MKGDFFKVCYRDCFADDRKVTALQYVREGVMSLPVIYTPFTKLQTKFENFQGGPCGSHYMDYMRCTSRVGLTRSHFECKNEMADFQECITNMKQQDRVRLMNAERKRQKRAHLEPLAKDVPERGY